MNDIEAAKIVKSGGVLVYPTETLFAVGADFSDEVAAKRISMIKNRPSTKPLPLIIGSFGQLEMVTNCVCADVMLLADHFWPGPLSILVKAKDELPNAIKDSKGYTSVRWTEHTGAASLCIKSNTPLIATSANFSGQEAAGRACDLDSDLVKLTDGVYDCNPSPKGGAPSTVIEALDGKRVRILRSGVISGDILSEAGFDVLY